MKIFDRDEKINFVDENNVILGYDMEAQCCEHADWFISDTQQDGPISRENDEVIDLTDFVFDTTFFKEVDVDPLHPYFNGDDDGRSARLAIFRIVDKDGKEKFVHLFNCHNGYYGHGFDFVVNGGCIKDGGL